MYEPGVRLPASGGRENGSIMLVSGSHAVCIKVEGKRPYDVGLDDGEVSLSESLEGGNDGRPPSGCLHLFFGFLFSYELERPGLEKGTFKNSNERNQPKPTVTTTRHHHRT